MKVLEAVNNAPYHTDWYIRRNNVLKAISQFAYGEKCQKRVIAQEENEDFLFRSLFFIYENELYVWTDLFEADKINGSQLEIVSESSEPGMWTSNVLYKHASKTVPVGVYMVQKLFDGKLKILEETQYVEF